MKSFIFFLSIVLVSSFQESRYQFSGISLDNRFSEAVEISSVAWVDDSLYLPSEKCGAVFIGKVDGGRLKARKANMLTRATEGLSYCNGFFYTSDDDSLVVYKYNKAFDLPPTRLPINLNGFSYEPYDGDGFEGIAVVNDSTFFLLLERVKNKDKNFAVLYKGILKGQNIQITEEKLLDLDKNTRYCDLHFRNDTLYLLKTSFYGSSMHTFEENNCQQRNDYSIQYLPINANWRRSAPAPWVSLKDAVLGSCADYNTNMEGITSDREGNIYAVSDNRYGRAACGLPGEKKTLLLMGRK